MPAPLGYGLAVVALAALLLDLLLWRRVSHLERIASRRRRMPGAIPLQSALQRVGLHRFSAYHDTGGDYSFALALLDQAGNGVVVTALYHRERCRVYAKPVTAWVGDQVLTDEEVEAVELARRDAEPAAR